MPKPKQPRVGTWWKSRFAAYDTGLAVGDLAEVTGVPDKNWVRLVPAQSGTEWSVLYMTWGDLRDGFEPQQDDPWEE